ncbi:MAG TPA: phosphoglucomutase [Cytophagales bacterium]|nr:phosphoglucomutase [Cytophagales bacterium]HAP61104.1 phosphoglucomutase [Cytophagales bacterium]
MDQALRDKAQSWLDSPIDADAKAEIESLLNNETELTEAFYKDLEFGTGGLRGIMGIGSNRMNKYTVGMATQGLANYLKKTFTDEEIKVAIAHDSRNNSRFFAETTAAVFSASGIKVYLFEDLRPTPELSFAIRTLGCHSGVVLTASHNPKEYNGYKAYWNDGAQLIPPHDKNVIDEVNAIDGIGSVNFEKNDTLIESIGSEIDAQYNEMIKGLSVNPEVIARQKDLKILFTPIHGTGMVSVPPALEAMGFTNVRVLESQSKPDGNFPTVVYPNPEEKEAMSMALKEAEAWDADLVMATDPDADRVGIGVKNHHGEWQLLNGNQTGSLLLYYMLQAWKDTGKLTGKQYVVKTIVTTDLIDTMAADFGVDCPNTLTGFKWIANIIREEEGKKEFIAGGEESYGYLVGDSVRDKDAVASCALISEMVAYAKDKGQSLFDLMMEMYQKYGFYLESLKSITKKGKTGAEEIAAMMEGFRSNPPAQLGGSPVVRFRDYQAGTEKDLITGEESALDYPKSNVLQFFTEDGTKISARPSGTEPKIKFYFSVNGDLPAADQFDTVQASLTSKIGQVVEDLQIA